MNIYTTLTAALEPADKGSHEIVRVEHELLAKPLLVTAHFAPERLNWTDAANWAEALTLGGFSWRLLTVEEAFFIPDRSKHPAFDPKVFMGAQRDYPWIWTATQDAEDPAAPSGCAWDVYLYNGYSARNYQDDECHVLAVRAGQS